MYNLSRDQKQALGNFFGSYSVAWLAGGFIAPLVLLKQNQYYDAVQILLSIIWAGISIGAMLKVTEGEAK